MGLTDIVCVTHFSLGCYDEKWQSLKSVNSADSFYPTTRQPTQPSHILLIISVLRIVEVLFSLDWICKISGQRRLSSFLSWQKAGEQELEEKGQVGERFPAGTVG